MINLQPMKRIMNATAKLQVTFAPISELNSWVQPIRFSAARFANGARASVRFMVREGRAIQFVRPVRFQPRSGVNAALRSAITIRNRLLRQRFFAPFHVPEHLAHAALAGRRLNKSFQQMDVFIESSNPTAAMTMK